MNEVGKSVASYSPGTNDLASLPSAAPMVAFIENAAAKLTGPTNFRRVPNMALLKLTTLRMTVEDRWELSFFGPMVAKKGEMISKTIKEVTNQLTEATYTQERQDLWAKLHIMENFGIAARGLAMAIDLLVHPSIITKGEVMEWFLRTVTLYDEYDAQLQVQAAIKIFKDGITLYYTRVRSYLEGTEECPPPRITKVPEVLEQRIEHLREVTRLQVGGSAISDQGAGSTGCIYESKTAMDFQGKSVNIDKNLKPSSKRGLMSGGEEDAEITPVLKKQRRERTASLQPISFFCGRKGHRARECRTEKDKWVEIDKLPASVRNIAEKVRQAASKE